MSAPSKTIPILGFEIPLYEHMLTGEIMELEELMMSGDFIGTKGDLNALGIIIRNRLDEPFDVDTMLRQPIDMEELGAAVEQLTAPFARGVRARNARAARLRASQLEPKELEKAITQKRDELAELEKMLDEAGGAPAP